MPEARSKIEEFLNPIEFIDVDFTCKKGHVFKTGFHINTEKDYAECPGCGEIINVCVQDGKLILLDKVSKEDVQKLLITKYKSKSGDIIYVLSGSSTYKYPVELSSCDKEIMTFQDLFGKIIGEFAHE